MESLMQTEACASMVDIDSLRRLGEMLCEADQVHRLAGRLWIFEEDLWMHNLNDDEDCNTRDGAQDTAQPDADLLFDMYSSPTSASTSAATQPYNSQQTHNQQQTQQTHNQQKPTNPKTTPQIDPGSIHGPVGQMAVVADQLCVLLPHLRDVWRHVRVGDGSLHRVHTALTVHLGLGWAQCAWAVGDVGGGDGLTGANGLTGGNSLTGANGLTGDLGVSNGANLGANTAIQIEGRARALVLVLKLVHLLGFVRQLGPANDAMLVLHAGLPPASARASLVRQVRLLGRLQQIMLQTATHSDILLRWRQGLLLRPTAAEQDQFLRRCLLDVPPNEQDLFPLLAAVLRLSDDTLLHLQSVLAHAHDYQLQLLALLLRKPLDIVLDAFNLAFQFYAPHSQSANQTSISSTATAAAAAAAAASNAGSVAGFLHPNAQNVLLSSSNPSKQFQDYSSTASAFNIQAQNSMASAFSASPGQILGQQQPLSPSIAPQKSTFAMPMAAYHPSSPGQSLSSHDVQSTFSVSRELRLIILRQPPKETIKDKILNPSPSVRVDGLREDDDSSYVVRASLVRFGEIDEIDDGVHGTVVHQVSGSRIVTFKKLKIRHTCKQLNCNRVSVRFQLLRQNEMGSYETCAAEASSSGVEVYSHTSQLHITGSKEDAPPTISGLVPDRGPVSGGTTFAILGSDMIPNPDMVVIFGGMKLRPIHMENGWAVARTPAYESSMGNPVMVSISLDGGYTSCTASFPFSYTNDAS